MMLCYRILQKQKFQQLVKLVTHVIGIRQQMVQEQLMKVGQVTHQIVQELKL